VHHWVLNVYNVVRVYRDNEFLEDKLSQLEDIWNKVNEYRSDRELYDKEILTRKKPLDQVELQEFAFIDV